MVDTNGSSQKPKRLGDPARGITEAPPNFGRPVIPHAIMFQGLVSNLAKVYRNNDEAVRNSQANALIMRKDCFIAECIETRQRAVASLNWHLEGEDKDDAELTEAVDGLTKIIKKIPYFTEYRRNLQESIWYGKSGIEHVYAKHKKAGRWVTYIKKWVPINGDKILFRYDDGTGDYDPDQVLIRVNATMKTGDALRGPKMLEMAGVGMAYPLDRDERDKLVIHRHMVEDAMFEDPTSAGAINGVGIRDRIYWAWFQRQETMAQLMEVVERTGQGLKIWRYPMGNDTALTSIQKVAFEQAHTNHVFIPVNNDSPDEYAIDEIPANTAGLEALKSMVHEFFGHQIKRYVLGQTLSTESDSTGLGSGVADLHYDSLLQIVHYDAANQEETLSRDLVRYLQLCNYPRTIDRDIYFKLDTEASDTDKKLQAYKSAWDMGLKVKASDVMDIIGASMPTDDDEVLQNPAMQQQQRLWDQTNPDHPDNPANQPPEDPNTPPDDDGGGGPPSNDDLFGPLASAGQPDDQEAGV